MIDPIWLGVKTAYDPYIAIEKVMLLTKEMQPFSVEVGQSWCPDCVFMIHHNHILVEIHMFGFQSMDVARDTLICWMWDMSKEWDCSTVSDAYDYTDKYSQNTFSGVNSQPTLDRDQK